MNGVRYSDRQTDAELMQAAKVDEGAFTELYGRHVSTVALMVSPPPRMGCKRPDG